MLTLPSSGAERTSNPATAVVDDAALVRRAQQDLSHFSELYQRHGQRVYRYLLSRVGNVHDAQDLTSQTFIAAMEGIHNFRGNSAFTTWLLGIARHKAADQFRLRKPEIDLETAVDVPDAHLHADDIVAQHLAVEQVARKLQTLSPDRAEALRLRLFAGLDVGDVARLMNKNEAAVRMLVFRGMQDLKLQLGGTEEALS